MGKGICGILQRQNVSSIQFCRSIPMDSPFRNERRISNPVDKSVSLKEFSWSTKDQSRQYAHGMIKE